MRRDVQAPRIRNQKKNCSDETRRTSAPNPKPDEILSDKTRHTPKRLESETDFTQQTCRLMRLQNPMLVNYNCNQLWGDQTLISEGLNDACSTIVTLRDNTEVAARTQTAPAPL